ncbi:MAG: aldo/keto reductase [Thermoplasmata archaeon]
MPELPTGTEYKVIGSIKERLSAIGLGTYGIRDYDRAEEAFLYAIEAGINFIDTAEIYNTEDFVGRIVRIVGRERLFITTKIWPNNLISRESVLRSAGNSLRRMGISYADLILIHWPNERMKIEDQVKNFEAVFDEGLTRYIGVSNFSIEQMEEARQSTRGAEIVCNQVEYNISKRDVEKDILPYCTERNMGLIAYTPIQKGRPFVATNISERVGKTPVQIALNYLISKDNVIPIPKTEDLTHMKEIIGSMGWRLSREDLQAIENM